MSKKHSISFLLLVICNNIVCMDPVESRIADDIKKRLLDDINVPCGIYYNQAELSSIASNPEGSMTASGSVLDGYALQGFKSLTGYDGEIYAAVQSPNQTKLVIISEDYTLSVWDYDSWECLKVFTEDGFSLNSVTWSPDGNKIVCGSDDFSVRVWDVCKLLKLISVIKCPTFEEKELLLKYAEAKELNQEESAQLSDMGFKMQDSCS